MLSFCFGMLVPGTGLAATETWNTGNWGTAISWLGSVIPDGVRNEASLTKLVKKSFGMWTGADTPSFGERSAVPEAPAWALLTFSLTIVVVCRRRRRL